MAKEPPVLDKPSSVLLIRGLSFFLLDVCGIFNKDSVRQAWNQRSRNAS